MNTLCIGDVCGEIGCNYLLRNLPQIKKQYGIDLCIVNGENSANGKGITVSSSELLYAAGADVITGGNHSFRYKEVFEKFEDDPFLLCPHNIAESKLGKGYTEIDMGKYRVAVINLSGRVYMPPCGNPFEIADELVKEAEQKGIRIILLDFHAEATAEKKALAYYLDGRISAIFGTHTHVPTADEQILPKGTGFITDLGMTGPDESVLGVKKELSIAKIKDGLPVKFELATGKCRMGGCIFNIDTETGKTLSVQRISISES